MKTEMDKEMKKEMWRLAAKPGTLQSSAHVLHMHMKVYVCVCVRCNSGRLVGRAYPVQSLSSSPSSTSLYQGRRVRRSANQAIKFAVQRCPLAKREICIRKGIKIKDTIIH